MAHIDKLYNDMVRAVLLDGDQYTDESRGLDVIEIPHHTLDIDITRGFPLLTTKQVFWKSVVHELIWFLSGSEYTYYLKHHGVKIWDKDAENFSRGRKVGRIYGPQWRDFRGFHTRVDQIKKLLETVEDGGLNNRRQIVTAWNPTELHEMALPPCHWAFQVFPTKGGFGLKWHQRSCDVFLGIPFNIASYATLGKMLEREWGIPFTRLIGDLSCVHIYEPHMPQVKEQLSRTPKLNEAELEITGYKDMLELGIEDFVVKNYRHHDPIKAEMYAKNK